jgi:hypothetical protein
LKRAIKESIVAFDAGAAHREREATATRLYLDSKLRCDLYDRLAVVAQSEDGDAFLLADFLSGEQRRGSEE